jgi:hypothetical protein
MSTNLLVGDEIVVPGLPQHKMRYVGPIGPYREDVLDPVNGQPVRFRHFSSIPNSERLRIGERGTSDWDEIYEIQNRALDVVARGVVNRPLGPNCEHLGSYVRHGKEPSSPQLKFWVGVGAAAALIVALR